MVKALEKKAFSIIELAVVMVVIIILAATAMVKFRSYDTLKLDAAARKVASDIRYAQRYTMTQMQRVWIDFEADPSNKYSIKLSDLSIITDPLTKAPFVVDFKTGELQGIKITNPTFGGGVTIVTDLGFDTSLGKPCGVDGSLNFTPLTAVGSVKISYKTLPQKTIYVEPETGEVSIQ